MRSIIRCPMSSASTAPPTARRAFPDGDVNAHAFIRVERQTLRKLPSSRDILFTIRIHLDPLAVLARHPDRATLASSFAGAIAWRSTRLNSTTRA